MVNDEQPQGGVGDEPDPTLPGAPARASGEVTLILSRIEQGEPQAAGQLLPLVYDELRKLAAARMVQEKPDQTLQATALVHEAYIRLVDVDKVQHWGSRGHFFAAAAEAMRRILIEQARRKQGLATGGQYRRVELSQVDAEIQRPGLDVLALNDALKKFAIVDPRAAELLKLRFFAGLTRKEAAETLGVSISTVDTDWIYAKCWLQFELFGSAGAGPPA